MCFTESLSLIIPFQYLLRRAINILVLSKDNIFGLKNIVQRIDILFLEMENCSVLKLFEYSPCVTAVPRIYGSDRCDISLVGTTP